MKAGTVFTLHVAEMDYEMTQLREQYNMTPIEFMEHIGVLGPNTLAAHSIRTTEHDVEILAKHGASVAHCIASNTKAAKGVAPVSLMHKHGHVRRLRHRRSGERKYVRPVHPDADV